MPTQTRACHPKRRWHAVPSAPHTEVMKHGHAYLNGQWLDAATLTLPLDDLGVTLGATVVERLRTFNGQPFRVEAHLRRLHRSLEIVGWNAIALVDEVRDAIAEFVARNGSLIVPGDDWAIVAFVTPGKTADAARPTVCVHGFPLPFAHWVHQFDAGVHVCVTSIRQVPANCWPAELKCRSRMHYYLADREAAQRFPGSRALLVDQNGFIGEASSANVVCYFADRGLVIPRQDGVLPGISQEFLFELADDLRLWRHSSGETANASWSYSESADELGIPRSEADILPGELATADEVFLTSTSVCIVPVTKVDDAPISGGTPGPLYRQLLAAWSTRVGVDVAAQARQFAGRD
jgi:branched-chain amino acid aminotransferase